MAVRRFGLAAACVVVALAWSLEAAAQARPSSLRVCSDPDNPPFSSDDPKERGLYLDIADLIARDLGIPVEVFWWRTHVGKRAVRLTLLAGRCDLQFGLPTQKGFMGRRVAVTKPIFRHSYAIVVPKDQPFSGLDDLRGKTVAVLFNTPPQNLLAREEDIRMVTFRDPDEAMAALARGEADAAFIWGPPAAWYNKSKLKGAYRVVPTEGPRLAWNVAIGVRGKDEALRRLLDDEIDRLQDAIGRLAAKYGLAGSEPLVLEWLPRQAGSGERGEAGGKETKRQVASAEIVRKGRRLFNGVLGCAHCHGPNAVVGLRKRDLRRLNKRHGEKAGEVFRTTVLKGRIKKGMPAWKGNISEARLAAIKAYLDTVQKE